MHLSDGRPSTVIKGTVGTSGVSKGDMCVLSSNTFVQAAGGATVLTVCGIALEDASSGDVGKFELVGDRIVTARYTGSSKTSVTDADISKVFDFSTAQVIDLDDTTGGSCFCVGYDNDLDTIDFIVTPAQRTL
jgi:hypothetical protein